MSANLIESLLEQQTVFSGRFMQVQCDSVRLPDGGVAVREYIRHPGAVAVLALTAAGELVLERQYRHPVGRVMVEIPAGKFDPGESAQACAERELQEETGYRAQRWTCLGEALACIGYSDERIVYFLAEELSAGAHRLDHGEFVETYTQPLAEVLLAAASGEINDSKTLVGLFWLQAHLMHQSLA